jgi:hypothetical protein
LADLLFQPILQRFPDGSSAENQALTRKNEACTTTATATSAFVYIAERDRVFAMCDQWFRGPTGQRVPIDESCQLGLPVSFDPETGAAKILHLDQWDPWE